MIAGAVRDIAAAALHGTVFAKRGFRNDRPEITSKGQDNRRRNNEVQLALSTLTARHPRRCIRPMRAKTAKPLRGDWVYESPVVAGI